MPPLTDALDAIATLMETAGLRWALIGGQAVNAWVEPRFTHDIDVTVAADVESVSRLREMLVDDGWRITHQLGADQPSGPDFLRFARGENDPPVDVQVAKTEYQARLLDRAVAPGGRGILVATAEDIIVLKLIAWRDKDEIDLQALSRLPGIDWAYVEHWAREWDLLDRLVFLRRRRDIVREQRARYAALRDAGSQTGDEFSLRLPQNEREGAD